MENIFENAKFGDKFITRDGRQAVFLGYYDNDKRKVWHKIVISGENEIRSYKKHGKSGLLRKCDGDFPNDLVARYQEPIDEDKLYKFSEDYFFSIIKNDKVYGDVCEAYKAGYRKANEE